MKRVIKAISIFLLIVLAAGLCSADTKTEDADREKSSFEIYYLNVGEGDAAVVFCDGYAMMIDGGPAKKSDYIYSFLKDHGVERLDYVIATHPDADHIGGLERVINAYHPDTIYYAAVPDGIEERTPLHTRLMDAVERVGAAMYEASDGALFRLGSAQVEIYPLDVMSDNGNDYSLITRVSFGEERLLFMGDTLEAAHNALLDSGRDMTATVIKMSHHGGKVNTTRKLLRAVNPKAAILTCGTENPYHHPHADTLAALEAFGIPYYRTDVCGDMILRFDGRGERFIETTR